MRCWLPPGETSRGPYRRRTHAGQIDRHIRHAGDLEQAVNGARYRRSALVPGARL